MRSVAIVDTSIFCNILNIPGKNESRDTVIKKLTQLIETETSLLLPMATVYETGNHIAQVKLSDGRQRRQCAQIFVHHVKQAINGDAPWKVMQLPDAEILGVWLSEFPDSAMRGSGIGDLSIIKEWEKMIDKTPSHHIFIWSLDSHLKGYNYSPLSI